MSAVDDQYFPVDLPRDLATALRPAAVQRDWSIARLVLELLEVLATDGIVDAVLDDGIRARPKRRAGRPRASRVV
jgi:hypothetical protein